MKNTFFAFLAGLFIVHANGQSNTYPSSGNVGIGTSTPSTLLHIEKANAGGYGPILWLKNGASSTLNNKATLVFSTNSGDALQSGAKIEAVNSNAGNGADDLTFFTWTGAAQTEKFRISASENIGIGTSLPSTILHVEKTNAGGLGPVLWLKNSASSTLNNKVALVFTTNSGDVFQTGAKIEAVNTDAGNGADALTFYTWTGAAQTEKLRINSSGNVGIGTVYPTEKLSINGNAIAKKFIVTQVGWSDYVFDENYKLRTLSSLEAFIKQNKHLPEIPTAKEVEEKGISVGDNQALLLKKIEELVLYLIDLKKENVEQQKQLEIQQGKINQLEKIIQQK